MNANRGPAYQGYSITAGLEQAAAFFTAKYGRDPAEVLQTGGGILCGPIVETASQGAQEGTGHTVTPMSAEKARKPLRTHSNGLLRRVQAAERQTSPERARQLALELGG